MTKLAVITPEGAELMQVAIFEGRKKLEQVTFTPHLNPEQVEQMRKDHKAFLGTVEDCRDNGTVA